MSQGKEGLLTLTLVLLVLVTREAGAADVGTASLPATPSAKANGEVVLVSGVASVIEHPRALIEIGTDPDTCVDFYVRSLGHPIPELVVGTGGLGAAKLLEAISVEEDCPQYPNRTAPTLSLKNVTAVERRIHVIIPAASFPELSAGATGQIILVQPAATVTAISITLKRQEYSAVWQGFLWFLGIAIPATVTATLGLLVLRATRRIERVTGETEALTRFRKDKSEDLKKFFSELYQQGMHEPSETFGGFMERELGNQQIMTNLPERALAAVSAALRAGDREKVASELARAFPNYKDTILKPVGKTNSK